jgi:hypothetical protein
MTRYSLPGKHIPAEIKELELCEQALELRKMGWDYAKIGRELQKPSAMVFKLVDELLAKRKAELTETAEEVRAIEIARLDGIVEAHWPTRSIAKSATVIMQTMERRSRYIGLDAPSTDLLDAATSLREFLTGSKTNIGLKDDKSEDTEDQEGSD